MWETILQAFTGDPIKVHRIGRDGGNVANPHLVINTSVQPIVWADLHGDKNATGRGVIGRFLVFNARSNVGYREAKANRIHPIEPELLLKWDQTINALLSIKDPQIFELTENQLEAFDSMRERNERQLIDPENRLDGFGMRLPGLLIRIAQLFTLIENPQASAIDDRCLKAALGLGDYLIDQRIAADVKADRTNEQRCLDKIAKMLDQFESVGDVGDVNRHFTFSTRDLQQQIKQQNWAKFGGVEAIEAALKNLEKWCWIESDDDRWLVRPDLMKHRW
jgi:hypothetical protein